MVLSLLSEDASVARDFTAADISRRVGDWCSRFAAAGLQAGERIALSPSRGLDLPAMHLAALASGLTVVPFNPALADGERRKLLCASGVRVAAASTAVATECSVAFADLALTWLAESDLEPAAGAAKQRASVDAAVDLNGNEDALLLFTSGTTGQPKGVPLSHAGLAANIAALEELWQRSPADCILHVLPAHHFHGLVLGVYASLTAGCRILLAPGFDPRATLDAIAIHEPNTIMGVPTMYARMLDAARANDTLTSLRLAVSGSAPLPDALAERFHTRFGIELINRYGLTETGIIAANSPSQPRRGSVGRPLKQTEIRIVANPGAAHECGEICVRSPTVTRCYEGDPQSTADAFRDGWFHTGDLGHLDEDGYLYVVGRSKELIIVGGSNVVPGEVEAVLADVDGVVELVVVGLAHDDLGEIVAAFVVSRAPHSDYAAIEARLRQAAAKDLAKYKQPREYRFVEEIPRNAMGKLDRARLRRL